MTTSAIEESQRKAAKIVGLAYVSALVFGVFAEFYVFGQLIVPDNATETAHNIVAHERLFRLGIAGNLMTFTVDVILITALYVVLKPVNRNLALVAAFFRLIETSIMVVTTLQDFDVLRTLSGADYLRVFEVDRLHALARLSIGAHGAAYGIGLLFFGFGSTVFCYRWFKSNYIPRALAAWGILASLWVGACILASIILPAFTKVVTVVYYAGPIFLFELTIGFWLLLKALRPTGIVESVRASS